MPQIRVPATAPEAEKDKAASPRPGAPADSTEGLFRISAEPRDVTIPATGEQATFALRVMKHLSDRRRLCRRSARRTRVVACGSGPGQPASW